MGGVEDNQWFDKFMDEIGLVFTKVDESIQKTIVFWTELTRDTFDDQPTQDLTGQPNSESGEEKFSHYPVAAVKERPIQHWSKCLAEVEEKPSQHWAKRASKIPESFIQEQGDDDYFDDDGDGDGDSDGDDEEEEEEEEEDESTVSEEESESSLKWNGDYQLLKNVDTSSEEDDKLSDDDDDEFGKCHYEDIEEVIEISRKNRMMSDLSNESFVVHDDEDGAWEKLQGFVDVRQEEIGNNTDFGGVETLFPESDWVYVTRD